MHHLSTEPSVFHRFFKDLGIWVLHTGSDNTSRPCGFKTRYISLNAFSRSSVLKILNKQFCAATSIDSSSMGKLRAFHAFSSINSGLNQGLSISASLKFSRLASSISSTASTPITPFGLRLKYENCSSSMPPPTPT